MSVVGTWMQNAALLWYVQTLTRDIGSEYWLGLTSVCTSAPIVLFSIHGGMVADRCDKRRLLIGTQSAALMLAGVFGALIAVGSAPLWTVFCFAGLWGAVLAYDIPGRQAFAVEMVGRRDLLSGIALNSAVFNMGRLLGPMAAGEVIALLGISACFLLNSVSFLGVVAALCLIQPAFRSDQSRHEHAPDRGLLSGFRAVLANPRILGLIATLGALLITGGAYLTLMPALAQNHLGLDEIGYSHLLTANGLGGLLGALSVASFKELKWRRYAIMVGILLVGSGLLALSHCTSKWPACIVLVFVGAGLVLFLSSTNSAVQLSVPDETRGRVMGIWVQTFSLSQPIGAYLAGRIASSIGTPATLQWVSVGSLFAGVLAAVVLFCSRFEE